MRNAADGTRELAMHRWGMPCPPQFSGTYVTNIRNTKSPHWRRWLGPASRCLVPATSFCEYADTRPRKTPTWFALDESRPVFAFAGIWTTWHGTRGTKAKPVEGEHRSRRPAGFCPADTLNHRPTRTGNLNPIHAAPDHAPVEGLPAVASAVATSSLQRASNGQRRFSPPRFPRTSVRLDSRCDDLSGCGHACPGNRWADPDRIHT